MDFKIVLDKLMKRLMGWGQLGQLLLGLELC